MTTKINGVWVNAPDGSNMEELLEYVKDQQAKYPRMHTLTVEFDGDYVGLSADDRCGFERIRRITGYLVGTMDKWNNGKRAEERDRVKHAL